MPKGVRADGKPGNRAGAGAGWGGPRKRASTSRFHAGDEHRGARNSATIAAKIADMEEIKTLYTSVLRDVAEPTPNRLNAADKLADRIEGKAIQKNINENTTVRTVIRAPAEPKDLAEWQQQYTPKNLNG